MYRMLDDAPYDKVSLSAIAESAGISKSLLQKYYPQKIDIIKEMLSEILETSYSFMDQVSCGKNVFQKISDFNMLFFAGTDSNFHLCQFILATVSSPAVLDLWIDTISSWLRRSVSGMNFTMLDVRCALTFAMGGSMHLFQHQEDLGIDYHFFCQHHIQAILEFLHFDKASIDAICQRTDEWIADIDVDEYLRYCEQNIAWLTL